MGVNRVILLGNLGADPEIRQLPNEGIVASLRVATSERWKDKATGEGKERTEWHTVEFFGKPAEVIRDHFRKGSQIYVEGSLRTDKWKDKEGNDRSTTKVRGSSFAFVDRKKADGGGAGGANGDGTGGMPWEQS